MPIHVHTDNLGLLYETLETLIGGDTHGSLAKALSDSVPTQSRSRCTSETALLIEAQVPIHDNFDLLLTRTRDLLVEVHGAFIAADGAAAETAAAIGDGLGESS